MTVVVNEEHTPLKAKTSLSNQVYQVLLQEISARFQPGDKLPSMSALCRRFGVSINTIGFALDMLAREGRVDKQQGRGVFVTRQKKPMRIGILSELNLFDPSVGPHFRAVASAIKSRVEELGAEPHFYMGHAVPWSWASDEPTCPAFWTDAEAGHLDGAVILNVPSTEAWRIRVKGCPVKAVGAMTEYYVEIDTFGVVSAAVQRLAERGCRRLGLMAWHSVEPFRKAVREHGLITSDAWIRSQLDPAVRGAGWDEFREIWLAPGDKPDGLIILDDMLFSDAQLAIIEMGVRVPQDLQLVVQTNRGALSPPRVPIIGIELDPAEEAAKSVDLLLKRLSGELLVPVTQLLSFREVMPQPVAADAEYRPSLSMAGDAGSDTVAALSLRDNGNAG